MLFLFCRKKAMCSSTHTLSLSIFLSFSFSFSLSLSLTHTLFLSVPIYLFHFIALNLRHLSILRGKELQIRLLINNVSTLSFFFINPNTQLTLFRVQYNTINSHRHAYSVQRDILHGTTSKLNLFNSIRGRWGQDFLLLQPSTY